jgi:hypothetical protein
MPAINLHTKFGYKTYCEVENKFLDAKYSDTLDAYKGVLFKERDKAERDVLHFLNDEKLTKKYKMDDNDKEGWVLWKEMSEKYSVLNYFYNRRS